MSNGGARVVSFKGSLYYFAVAESPDHHATVWRLWSPSGKGDVYLGARFAAARLKLSIHESGLRLLREKAAPGSSNLPTPTLRWSGPPRHMPGLEIVWHIITPFGGCREAKLHPRFKDRVAWIPQTPVPFTATEFELVLSFGLILRDEELPRSEVPGTECLLRWRLGNGETLFLLRRPVQLTEQQRVAWGIELINMRLPPEWEQNRRSFDHRAHLIVEQNGYRGCVDLAYDA